SSFADFEGNAHLSKRLAVGGIYQVHGKGDARLANGHTLKVNEPADGAPVLNCSLRQRLRQHVLGGELLGPVSIEVVVIERLVGVSARPNSPTGVPTRVVWRDEEVIMLVGVRPLNQHQPL